MLVTHEVQQPSPRLRGRFMQVATGSYQGILDEARHSRISMCLLLQPTLTKLGVRMDTRTAQALINKESGLAGKVLYSIIQALGSMKKDLQVCDDKPSTSRQQVY